MSVGKDTVKEGEYLSIDGTSGKVYVGAVPLTQPSVDGTFSVIISESNKMKKMAVMANADSPQDAMNALRLGAEGIGLCRTEHMFFGDRLELMQRILLSHQNDQVRDMLWELYNLQCNDFLAMYNIMGDHPITIRLLDPPLHEFLPKTQKEIANLGEIIGIGAEAVQKKIASMAEINPMLGNRGARLGITYPQVYDMQIQAIFDAALHYRKNGHMVTPQIMIPFIGLQAEFITIKDRIDYIASQKGLSPKDYRIGAMIEIPRAALVAGSIASAGAQFFSFGTNDLTQMTLGYSRNDASKFLGTYLKKGIMQDNPFKVLDQKGVGSLIMMAIESGRRINPNLEIGVCGEQGSEQRSIQFFYNAGVNYVSCSPFEIPSAIIAAAQASIQKDR